MFRSPYRLSVLVAVASAFLLAPVASASAATIFVGKSGSGGGSCAKPNFKNIAAAVNAASANDTIHICKGTWTGASNRGIQFAKPLKFVGDGPGQTIIDLQNQDLFLNGTNGAISVSAMKITKGLTTVGYGGAVLAYDDNSGTPYDLTAKNVVITDTAGNSYGSALYGDNVTVSNSTFTDNTADDDGTVYAETSALVEDSTFRRNVNGGDAGGVFVNDDGPADYDLVVKDSVFTGNTGSGGYYGGTLCAYNGGAKVLRVTGSGSDTGEYGGFLYSDENAFVSDVELSDNHSSYDGGAIYANSNLDVSDSEFSNNLTDGSGGGVYVGGDLNSQRATYSNNTSGGNGGGMYVGGDFSAIQATIENNDAGSNSGAAAYVLGFAVIQQSSISDNSCTGECDALMLNNAGEIVQSTVAGNSVDLGTTIYTDGGELDIVNSTVANNEGTTTVFASGDLVIGFSTIADNTNSGSYVLMANNTMSIGSSILKGSGNCSYSSFTNNQFNVITTDSGCDDFVGPTPAAKVTAAELDLQPLANNGGPTKTRAITANSAALDAGDPADYPSVDQRDWLRGPVPDSGAYEYGAIAPKPSIVPRGKAGAKTLRVRVGCKGGDPCTIVVTGKLKGGKGKLQPKVVDVPEGETVLVTMKYTKKLARELADKGGRQKIRVTAERLYGGKASTTLIYSAPEPNPVTG